jgi:hypothetical protein
MMGVKSHNFCIDLLRRLGILTLTCEYIFSLINFITNKEHFQTNADVHNVNTRHKHYLHEPTANLSCFQKSTCAGIKIFNSLPSDLRNLMIEKERFKIALKQFLETGTHSVVLVNTSCLKMAYTFQSCINSISR